MRLKRRTGGQVSRESEFINFDEMRKYLGLDEERNSIELEEMQKFDEMRESRLLYAGDPSESDPGYEVPQILMTRANVIQYNIKCFISFSLLRHTIESDQVTEDFETAYARAMREYERDLRLRQVLWNENKNDLPRDDGTLQRM